MSDRINIPLEKAILGALMLEPRMVPIIVDIAPPEDFHHPQHALAMEGMRELSRKRQPIDAHTLAAWSGDKLDAKYISSLAYGIGTAENVEAHAKIVSELARIRRIGASGAETAAMSRDTTVTADDLEASARASLNEAAKRHNVRDAADCATMGLELMEDIGKAIERQLDPSGISGVPSGLAALDVITTGAHPAQLIVIGARPGTGKSAMANKMLRSAAEATKKPALMFQIEMPRKAMFMRMVATATGIESKRIRAGHVDSEQVKEIQHAIQELSLAPIRVDDDGSITLDEIRARAIRRHTESPLSVVMVDYLQKIRLGRKGSRMESREREVNEIVGGLAALAKELNVPVITLSSLNRECEARPDKRPAASDIRESGGVESDANVVILLYRAWKYRQLRKPGREGIVEAIVAKNRDGEEGTAILGYIDPITRFIDVDDDTRDRYLASWEAPEPKRGGGSRGKSQRDFYTGGQ